MMPISEATHFLSYMEAVAHRLRFRAGSDDLASVGSEVFEETNPKSHKSRNGKSRPA